MRDAAFRAYLGRHHDTMSRPAYLARSNGGEAAR